MNSVTLPPYLIDTLMRDLVGHGRKPSAFVVFLYLWYCCAAQDKNSVAMSLQNIAEGCGLSKRAVQVALGYLKARRLVSIEKGGATEVRRYTVNEPWKRR
jgi:hypothetical protein